MSECKANETAACCCVDVGAIIDNSDRIVDFEQLYATQELAQQALNYLTEKANAAASEPCQISSQIQESEGGYKLSASFEFAYQVEMMIFQLSTR